MSMDLKYKKTLQKPTAGFVANNGLPVGEYIRVAGYNDFTPHVWILSKTGLKQFSIPEGWSSKIRKACLREPSHKLANESSQTGSHIFAHLSKLLIQEYHPKSWKPATFGNVGNITSGNPRK